ncbi:hypothetical protein RV134_330068 [Roseovarius sp. EC-HK134]|nr:hypothetical protein RV420_390068 [Roseovarius sp. EC-SD190]VVT24887.1 hypothetical protein RV134_330068 [Roseovarius sp. EC-HK134]
MGFLTNAVPDAVQGSSAARLAMAEKLL